jgi:hypothetical protein
MKDKIFLSNLEKLMEKKFQVFQEKEDTETVSEVKDKVLVSNKENLDPVTNTYSNERIRKRSKRTPLQDISTPYIEKKSKFVVTEVTKSTIYSTKLPTKAVKAVPLLKEICMNIQKKELKVSVGEKGKKKEPKTGVNPEIALEVKTYDTTIKRVVRVRSAAIRGSKKSILMMR